MKFSRAVTAYMKAKRTQNLSNHTLEQNLETLRQLSNIIGDKDIEDINSGDIEDFISTLQQKGLSSGTVGIRYTCLLTFFKWLKTQDKIKKNPIREGDLIYVQHPKVRHKQRIAVTDGDYKLMLMECAGSREKAILALMFRGGLRVGELKDIQGKHIRRDGDDLFIKVHGKGDKWREVPIVSVFKDEQTWIDEVTPRDPEQLLFPEVTQPKVYYLVKRTSEATSISNRYSPHCFRHGCAVGLLKHGVDVRIVQQILGHSSIATTQIYTHMNADDIAKVLEKSYGGIK